MLIWGKQISVGSEVDGQGSLGGGNSVLSGREGSGYKQQEVRSESALASQIELMRTALTAGG